MVASSGLLFCSRKHSISSDLGSGSRIIDNEKRKYWGAWFHAPFCCMFIRWCQMLNSTTTFHPSRKCLDCSLPSLPVRSFLFRSSFTIPYALRIKWGTGTLNPHPTIPNSPGKLQRKKLYLRADSCRRHPSSLGGKEGRRPTSRLRMSLNWIRNNQNGI